MKIAFFPNQIALNGQLTLRSFIQGAKKHGHEFVENSLDADAAVIWSVLWNGRLAANKIVYDAYRNQGKPVFVLEVGALRRGYTWKVSANHTTSQGIYGHCENVDSTRPGKIGTYLKPLKLQRKDHILIACQHQKSQQWQGLPSIEQWVEETVVKLRTHTDRPILIRPHPRSRFLYSSKNAKISTPIKVPNTHEEYDIDYNCHGVVNYNSGPGIAAAIYGTPVICDESSLAYPVSDTLENIENIQLADREKWFLEICHTEWTNEEISRGEPLARILPLIKS
jgi:hypothetical protein